MHHVVPDFVVKVNPQYHRDCYDSVSILMISIQGTITSHDSRIAEFDSDGNILQFNPVLSGQAMSYAKHENNDFLSLQWFSAKGSLVIYQGRMYKLDFFLEDHAESSG
jgi:hypothetical protein